MSSRVTVLLVVLVAALAGAYFFLSGEPADQGGPAAAPPAGLSAAEIAKIHLDARERGEISISPCSASGQVRDAATGRGLAGALVMLTPHGFGRPSEPGAAAGPLTARSDAGGEWSLPLVPPGRYSLTASAPGYLSGELHDLTLKPGAPNRGLDLTLAAGGFPLRGTISDVSGGPIEGVVVSVERSDDRAPLDFSRAPAPAITDAEGRYALQVASGRYSVEAWHSDYAPKAESTDVTEGPRTLDLRLTPGGAVEGVVRTAAGEPVADAYVTRSQQGGVFIDGGAVLTDAQGRFRIAGLGSGSHALAALAAGHASREPVKVELGLGEVVTGVELVVDRAFKISGFVVPRGEPRGALVGVMVGAYSLSPMTFHAAVAPSAADGYFEVLGVRPGTYSLAAAAQILGGPVVTIADRDVGDAVVELDLGVAITGRVDPPGLARISLEIADEEPGFLTVIGNLGNMLVRGAADAKGEFSLRPIQPGKLRVVAVGLDGARGQVDVEVGPRGASDVRITLQPRATVTGRVVDAGGSPLTKGRVEFMTTAPQRGGGLNFNFNREDEAPISEDGTFTLRGLEGGEYEIRVKDRAGNVVRWANAEGTSYEPLRRTVVAGVLTPGVDLRVERRDGVLRGVVLDPSGAPLPDAWVTATPERESEAEALFRTPDRRPKDERVGEAPAAPKDEEYDVEALLGMRGEPVLSGEDGRFEITGLARRRYSVSAEGEKGAARVKLSGVVLGSDLRLQLAPLGEIRGVVRDHGVPVPRYTLNVRRETGRGGFTSDDQQVDRPSGEFKLDRLDPTVYTLTAIADAGIVEHKLTLGVGERPTLTLDLQPWGKVRGVLVDARTGAPLAGVSLHYSPRNVTSVDAGQAIKKILGGGDRTDREGRFEVGRISPGKGTLRFLDGDIISGRESASVEFELEPGAEKDLGTVQGVALAKVPKPERGELGLRLSVASEARRPRPPGEKPEPLKQKEDEKAPRFLWVQAVTIGGPAEKAGLQPGDRIVAVDGSQVQGLGAENAERLLNPASVRVGQSVSIEFQRGDRAETATIEAAPRKDEG